MSKICPNCNRPLDEHYVAKSATLNRPHVYICPTNVCPVDELFEEVPVAPAQPAKELRGASFLAGRMFEFYRMKRERPIDPSYWDAHEEREMKQELEKLQQAVLQRERK
jgi:hypothetical protein